MMVTKKLKAVAIVGTALFGFIQEFIVEAPFFMAFFISQTMNGKKRRK